MKYLAILVSIFTFVSCGSFKAERVDAKKSDEKALQITDNWVSQDTTNAVTDILKQMREHPGYKKYMAQYKGSPKLFIAEVQNTTSEAYFPIADLNDELLNEVSLTGEFTLVDAAAREALLKEITYQNDGMVDPKTSKSIGKQTGADIMIFGNVYMKPESRDGKTIKQYSINIRLTDIEKGVEILRTRAKVDKFSNQKAWGF